MKKRNIFLTVGTVMVLLAVLFVLDVIFIHRRDNAPISYDALRVIYCIYYFFMALSFAIYIVLYARDMRRGDAAKRGVFLIVGIAMWVIWDGNYLCYILNLLPPAPIIIRSVYNVSMVLSFAIYTVLCLKKRFKGGKERFNMAVM